jgi:hypothetical protein
MMEEEELERALQLSGEEEAKWIGLQETIEVSQAATAAPLPPQQEEILPPPSPLASVWPPPQMFIVIYDDRQ